jgi:histidine ammonia-lyase
LDFLRPLTSTKPIEAVYKLIRSHVPRLDQDRFLSPDIKACVELVRSGQIWKVVKEALTSPSDLDEESSK